MAEEKSTKKVDIGSRRSYGGPTDHNTVTVWDSPPEPDEQPPPVKRGSQDEQ